MPTAKTIRSVILFVVAAIAMGVMLFLAFKPKPIPTPRTLPQTPMQKVEQTLQHDVQVLKKETSTEFYHVVYKIHLMNKQVEKAYQVALIAVQEYPDDIAWRERLAQAAVWAGHPREGLSQWIYIIQNSTVEDARIFQIIKIAKLTANYEAQATLYEILMARGYRNETVITGWVNAQIGLGTPEKAIAALNKIPDNAIKPYQLQLLFQLYTSIDQPQLAISTLQKLERLFGKTLKLSIQQATLFAKVGDFDAAYNRLVRVITMASPNNAAFWQMLGDLAWYLQEGDVARQAYSRLLALKKITNAQLIALITLTAETNPNKAFELALYAYEQYPTKRFAQLLLSLGLRLEKYAFLNRFLDNLPAEQLAQIKKTIDYWQVKLGYLKQQKDDAKVITLYRLAMQQHPYDISLKVDFLWFLINSNQTVLLRQYLVKWHRLLAYHVELEPPFAFGYALLGENQLALQLFQRMYPRHQHNPNWLLGFADIQEKNHFPQNAALLRKRAWFLLVNEFNHRGRFSSQDKLHAFASLSNQHASADLSLHLASHVTQNPTEEANKVAIDHALNHDNFALAEAIFEYNKAAGFKTPLYAQLSIALNRNDKPAMAELLNKHVKELPIEDRVIAADRLGWVGLSQTLAYEGLKEQPHNARMYELFKEIMLKRANKIGVDSQVRQFGTVSQTGGQAYGTFFISPNTAIKPYVRAWYNSLRNTSDLAFVPTLDVTAGAILLHYFTGGQFTLGAGMRNALRTFATASASLTYKINHEWTAQLELGYHQLADESNALLVAGMKNFGKLFAQFQATAHDLFTGSFAHEKFEGQDGSNLGTGNITEVGYIHKFWLEYPDVNIGLIGLLRQYHAETTLSPTMQALVPAGIIPASDFFVPRSDGEALLQLGFGQAFAEDYTHEWKPFVQVNTAFSTFSGLGYGFYAGIAGSVVGRDHLALTLTYSKNTQTAGQTDIIAGVNYYKYF